MQGYVLQRFPCYWYDNSIDITTLPTHNYMHSWFSQLNYQGLLVMYGHSQVICKDNLISMIPHGKPESKSNIDNEWSKSIAMPSV